MTLPHGAKSNRWVKGKVRGKLQDREEQKGYNIPPQVNEPKIPHLSYELCHEPVSYYQESAVKCMSDITWAHTTKPVGNTTLLVNCYSWFWLLTMCESVNHDGSSQ